MQAINSYLPAMEQRRYKLTEIQLIKWCSAPSLPPHWRAEFALADGPYLTNMLVVIRRLRAIEERDAKDEEVRCGKNGRGKHNNQQKFKGKGQGKGGKGKDNSNGKAKEKGNGEMKNPCQKHEWHDCPENFRNKKKSKNKKKKDKGKQNQID
eukprot:13046164-Ditylum_brightwellii.AAC.1